MKICESTKSSLLLANNASAITEPVFRSLLENCFSVLSGSEEIHNILGLCYSKPDQIKELYAALLSITAEFARNNQNGENISEFLTKQCNYSEVKVSTYRKLYEKVKERIEIALLNIGGHPPHITDVNWKIDYVIKANNFDQNGGPLFRIGLQTEQFHIESNRKITELLHFTCTTQELQDLVYKLKDAVRHCQRISTEL